MKNVDFNVGLASAFLFIVGFFWYLIHLDCKKPTYDKRKKQAEEMLFNLCEMYKIAHS